MLAKIIQVITQTTLNPLPVSRTVIAAVSSEFYAGCKFYKIWLPINFK